MAAKTPTDILADASVWWDTSIIDIHPGRIAIRGYPIERLIGRARFPDMIRLMLHGDLPTRGQSELLKAALVPGVDHGPHAPSTMPREIPYRYSGPAARPVPDPGGDG